MFANDPVYAFRIDDDGYIIGSILADPEDLKDDEITDPIPEHVVFKAKWTGSEWVEGATAEEIRELTEERHRIPVDPQEQRIADLELILADFVAGL